MNLISYISVGTLGLADTSLEIRNRHDRYHRHHLLFLNECVIRIGLCEEELRAGWNRGSGMFGEFRRFGTDKVAIHGSVRTAAALARFEGEC